MLNDVLNKNQYFIIKYSQKNVSKVVLNDDKYSIEYVLKQVLILQ